MVCLNPKVIGKIADLELKEKAFNKAMSFIYQKKKKEYLLNKAGKCFVPAERYIWASLILLHYSKRMSKIIWKQRFIATAPTENTSRRQQSSEPERPFSYRVGVRL